MKIGRALHKRAKGEKGFTLIELIVVIAVLGVLATLVIPKVVNIKDEAKGKVDAANEKIIRNALERYNATEGSYPSTTDGLNKLVTENYLDEIPKKSDDSEWEYTFTNGESYTLN